VLTRVQMQALKWAARKSIKLATRNPVNTGALLTALGASLAEFKAINSAVTLSLSNSMSATPSSSTNSTVPSGTRSGEIVDPTPGTEDTKALYLIVTKYGTSYSDFQAFIKDLDNAVGQELAKPTVPTQGYSTSLTAVQLAEVESHPLVAFATLNASSDMEFFDDSNSPSVRNETERQRELPKIIQKRSYVERHDSGVPYHLRMLSTPDQDPG
jgi:hypothetical protein